jgi:hypothetical protein
MVGEIKILEANCFSIIRGYFNREDELFEQTGELDDVRILIVSSIFPKILSEVSCLQGLIALFEVDDLRIRNCSFFSLFSIVVNLLQNCQNIDNVNNLLAVSLSQGFLLCDELQNFSLVEVFQDLSDKCIFNKELSVL